ncbi:hypothetical protein Cni_G11928 [Canna indica]|uniref:Uncharacterized protein n=1 Tax=Canna indica TaxID=4628 RepID=A0AAQ3QBN2_9LILI|nr:hypothetical protein Cni_G11928 [Canna indica]
MGCVQSRVDNEEVARCKERRQWMKKAVEARNAFAAAHSAYGVALKNTGAALNEFGEGEVTDLDPGLHSSSSATAGDAAGSVAVISPATVQPPLDSFLPPPPPPSEFSPSPLQRSVSMPDLPKKFPSKIQPDAAIREEEDEGEEEADDEEEEGSGLNLRRRPAGAAASSPYPSPSPTPPPPPPPQPSPPPPPQSTPPQSTPPQPMSETWDYFFAMDQNMTGPSLIPADEVRPEREDVAEEKFNTPAPPPSVANQSHVVGDNEEPATPKKVMAESPLPPKVPKKPKQGGNVHHQHAASAPTMDAKRGKIVPASRPSINLIKVLKDLDDLFLRASESTHDVSKMLEATRMHYHSNFADSRGHIDHSARVMRVITWNRSFKGVSGAEGTKDGFDDDDDEWETHATVLDKILAWEKKLYDEVKAGEHMKLEYHRKVALLNRQKKRGVSTEALERTKAAVSHLHTRYIVDMQSMDTTVSEIQRLRDKQLYPKLKELVEGMSQMWQNMHMHHHSQLKRVEDLKALDISNVPRETTTYHYKHTLQLLNIVKEWHSEFHNLVSHQKEYVNALNSWLKSNFIPLESNLKEKVSSPQRPAHAPIQALLHAWHEHLDTLTAGPAELAKSAIFSFSAVITTIASLQEEELRQKEKCEETHKDYLRKKRAFEDWYQKYAHRRTGSSEVGEPESGEATSQKDLVEERKTAVETLKSTLAEEVEAHRRLCKQAREKSFNSLRTHLPELFRAMMQFSDSCSRMYSNLMLISEQNQPAD